MNTALHDFLEKIMDIELHHRMGASMFTPMSSTFEVVGKLKMSTAQFAQAYGRTGGEQKGIIDHLSEEIEGYIQTLIVLNMLTVKEGNSLVDELKNLTDPTAGAPSSAQ
jgi:hypothetical protein